MQQKTYLISLIKTIGLLAIVVLLLIINIRLYVQVRTRGNYLKDQIMLNEEMKQTEEEFYKNSKLQEISNFSTFYTVKLCTESYFTVLHSLWNGNTIEQNFINAETIKDIVTENAEDNSLNQNALNCLYNILAPEYIKDFDISISNLQEKFNSKFVQTKTIIKNVYEYNITSGITMFLVDGNNYCDDGTQKKDFSIMLIVDNNQKSFCVYPNEYITKYKINENNTNLKESPVQQITKIPQNNYNKKPTDLITNAKIVDYYFDLYKFNVKYDIESAYNMLNEEYREKRFGNLENYKQYINNNYSKLNCNLKKYKINRYSNYKQYFCIDENDNYYIFQISKCLDYNVILDTYTIDINEFEEKFIETEETGRVALNIQKVFDALNSKDYNYVYSKFSDGFKSNYFKTLGEFETYAKDKFFDKNEVEYLYYKKESEDYYSYTIKVKNANNQEEEIVLKIIMKLQNGTNFLMSFNV